MQLRDSILLSIYTSHFELEGPYMGATFGQIRERLSDGSVSKVRRELSSLVEEGFIHEEYEQRVGFENLEEVSKIRTYRLAAQGYSRAESLDAHQSGEGIRFTTPTQQRF